MLLFLLELDIIDYIKRITTPEKPVQNIQLDFPNPGS